MTAFVLGAGKGTRLRPLTQEWPKPLLEFASGKRLVEAAFDAVLSQAPVSNLIVNTHWCAHRWEEVYPKGVYQTTPLHFIHEEILLDTGGGLANIWSHWQALKSEANESLDESLLLYNGDILSSVPLAPLLQAHEQSQNLCTLLLRSQAGNVAFDEKTGKIADLRSHFGRNDLPQFTYGGIALIRPQFHPFLRPAGDVFSLVESWLKLISQEDALGGVVIDEGSWADLGTLEEWEKAKNLH